MTGATILDRWQPAAFGERRKPCPAAFAETFIREGWRGVEIRFGSRTGCNKRWVNECGGCSLIQARRLYLQRLRSIRKAA